MIKLLRADLTRMRKSKSFWICVIISFAFPVFNTLVLNIDIRTAENTAKNILGGASVSLVLTAVFAALFLGTDYSQHTIRNKLIVGSNRTSVYLSNFITITIGALALLIAEDIPEIAAALFGKSFGMTANEFAFQLFIIVCAVIAMCAVFTLLGMLITVKPANTAISVVVTFALVTGGGEIVETLRAHEYLEVYETDENGVVVEIESVKNSKYVGGAMRKVLITVNDVLPTGQINQIEIDEPHNKKLMPLYSLGILAVTTAAGIAVFRRKDLK